MIDLIIFFIGLKSDRMNVGSVALLHHRSVLSASLSLSIILSSKSPNPYHILKMTKLDLNRLILISAILRLILVFYGEWQDAHMEVPYTDVDYLVFSDASAMVASGRSPFERSTYRYSPLLAFLLLPNSWIHRCWGKFLFSSAGMASSKSRTFIDWFRFPWIRLWIWFMDLLLYEFDLSMSSAHCG